MEAERPTAADAPAAAKAVAKPVPTEAEVVRALEEWEDEAAYRKVRHAANVGGCYSSPTICLAHDTLQNQRLTDDLVTNRLRLAEFSASELNPTELGAPSVCEHVSVPVLNRLLAGMRGTFTPEQAWHFMDYHIEECDYETLCLVADRTGFTKAERREFIELHDWMANPEFAPGAPAIGGASVRTDPKARRNGCNRRTAKAVLVVLATASVALVAVATGAFAIVGIAAVGVVSLALGSSGRDGTAQEKYPDQRSDYNRRVWADDHNWEADGDTDHNWEADGDCPQ